jgi:hypothetical protein
LLSLHHCDLLLLLLYHLSLSCLRLTRLSCPGARSLAPLRSSNFRSSLCLPASCCLRADLRHVGARLLQVRLPLWIGVPRNRALEVAL